MGSVLCYARIDDFDSDSTIFAFSAYDQSRSVYSDSKVVWKKIVGNPYAHLYQTTGYGNYTNASGAVMRVNFNTGAVEAQYTPYTYSRAGETKINYYSDEYLNQTGYFLLRGCSNCFEYSYSGRFIP